MTIRVSDNLHVDVNKKTMTKRRSRLRNCLLRTGDCGLLADAADGSGSVASAAHGKERNQNSWHLARVFTIKVAL